MTRKDYAIVPATAFALVGGYFVVLTPGEAQEQPAPPPPNLFTPVDIPDWQDPLMPNDNGILRSRPVAVNFDILTAAQPAEPGADPPAVPIRFNLFDDLSVTAVFHKAEPRYSTEPSSEPSAEPTGYIWHGLLVGDEQVGQVVMITDPGVCLADIHIAGVGWYKIRPVEGTQHAARELAGTAEAECEVVSEQGSSGQGAGPEGGGGCGISIPYSCVQGTSVDVMVLYTPAALAAAGGQIRIEDEIAMAVADANQAYANSLVSIELNLVHVQEVQISGSFNVGQVINPWDNILDEVHALRDSVRADLVSVVTGLGENGQLGGGNENGISRV